MTCGGGNGVINAERCRRGGMCAPLRPYRPRWRFAGRTETLLSLIPHLSRPLRAAVRHRPRVRAPVGAALHRVLGLRRRPTTALASSSRQRLTKPPGGNRPRRHGTLWQPCASQCHAERHQCPHLHHPDRAVPAESDRIWRGREASRRVRHRRRRNGRPWRCRKDEDPRGSARRVFRRRIAWWRGERAPRRRREQMLPEQASVRPWAALCLWSPQNWGLLSAALGERLGLRGLRGRPRSTRLHWRRRRCHAGPGRGGKGTRCSSSSSSHSPLSRLLGRTAGPTSPSPTQRCALSDCGDASGRAALLDTRGNTPPAPSTPALQPLPPRACGTYILDMLPKYDN